MQDKYALEPNATVKMSLTFFSITSLVLNETLFCCFLHNAYLNLETLATKA